LNNCVYLYISLSFKPTFMERRDYILHQIQEMGAFLVRLVTRLRKKNQKPNEVLTRVSNDLKKELHLDLDEVLFLDDESFIAVLKEKLLSTQNFEHFAVFLEQFGDMALDNETFLRQQIYYTKALTLLNFMEENSQNYSMERQEKIAQIRLKLLN